MATSFQKNYSVDVTFTKDDASSIADTDINAVDLRTAIKKEIAEVCTRSSGIFETRPGTVTES